MTEYPGLNQDFVDLLEALGEADAEFLVVGAHAMAAHGIPRATGDLDVLVRPTLENAKKVIEGLRRFGAPIDAHGIAEQDLVTPGTVYQMGLPPRRIDILSSISGVSFEEAASERLVASVDGLELAFIGRRALLANKRATGRDKDLLDAKLLEESEPAAR